MKTNLKASRILGIAFLFQFITSFSSGVFIKSAWFVPEDMSAAMLNIAANPDLLRLNIFLDTLTALGVIFLGVALFHALRSQGERIALTALSFYILEAALLAVSRLDTFSLLRLSQEYVAAGQPAELLLLGRVSYESMEFVGNTLHMLAFCTGAILYYFLLDRSQMVPRWMSLWGLAAVFPMLVGTIAQVFGRTLPFHIYVPYVPFELVIGIWFLVRQRGPLPMKA